MIIIVILMSVYSGICFAIESFSNVLVGEYKKDIRNFLDAKNQTLLVAGKKGRLSQEERTTQRERLRKVRMRQQEMEQKKASVFNNNLEYADRFVAVPGGCFEMGDLFGDGALEEGPVHEVCVNDFYMGKYEVTQKEWEKLMSTFLKGNNPSCFKACPNCPVEKVSWNDVQAFIKKLRQKTGMHFRFPTEAEWEYAARSGGKREKYAGTSDDLKIELYAWYAGNSEVKTHPVGLKKPNGLGLYDMSGNIKEWVADWYGGDYYSDSPGDNPQGPSSGVVRVLRGGSWGNEARHVRTAVRIRSLLDHQHCGNGFRLSLSFPSRF